MDLKEDIEELRSQLDGELLTPDSEKYSEACLVWNRAFENTPAVIIRCKGASDAIKAVKFGTKHFEGGRTSIRSGGHSYSGMSTSKGGLIIDMSQNRGVVVDVDSRTAWLEAGVQLMDVDKEADKYNLATPGGIVSDTGYAGLALGGGVGHLGRLHGLAVDSVLEIDVVTADGQLRKCNTTENADLFWALRGAGHNFGVATGFKVKLHPIPEKMYGGSIIFDIPHIKEVLKLYSELTENGPRYFASSLTPIHNDDGRFVVFQIWCTVEYGDEAKDWVERFRNVAPNKGEDLKYMTFPEIQSCVDAGVPPTKYYANSRWITRHLKDGDYDKIIDVFSKMPKGLIFLVAHGGAIGDVPVQDMAFGQRDIKHLFEFLLQLGDGDLDSTEGLRGFCKSAFESTLSGIVSRQRYTNHVEPGNTVSNSDVFPRNYEKLLQLKRKYDPENFFQRNQNIDPKSNL